MYKSEQKGFTLIELLVVIVIIGLLAAIIFVAVDPAKRFGDARDARRRAEVVSILNAVLKHQVDHDGDLPAGIDATVRQLGTGSACDTCPKGGATPATCLNLAGDLVDEYLASIPMDPDAAFGSAAATGYYIQRTANGRLTVGSCNTDNATAISVSR